MFCTPLKLAPKFTVKCPYLHLLGIGKLHALNLALRSVTVLAVMNRTVYRHLHNYQGCKQVFNLTPTKPSPLPPSTFTPLVLVHTLSNLLAETHQIYAQSKQDCYPDMIPQLHIATYTKIVLNGARIHCKQLTWQYRPPYMYHEWLCASVQKKWPCMTFNKFSSSNALSYTDLGSLSTCRLQVICIKPYRFLSISYFPLQQDCV